MTFHSFLPKVRYYIKVKHSTYLQVSMPTSAFYRWLSLNKTPSPAMTLWMEGSHLWIWPGQCNLADFLLQCQIILSFHLSPARSASKCRPRAGRGGGRCYQQMLGRGSPTRRHFVISPHHQTDDILLLFSKIFQHLAHPNGLSSSPWFSASLDVRCSPNGLTQSDRSRCTVQKQQQQNRDNWKTNFWRWHVQNIDPPSPMLLYSSLCESLVGYSVIPYWKCRQRRETFPTIVCIHMLGR